MKLFDVNITERDNRSLKLLHNIQTILMNQPRYKYPREYLDGLKRPKMLKLLHEERNIDKAVCPDDYGQATNGQLYHYLSKVRY